jgi:tripeptide aminopeptidase
MYMHTSRLKDTLLALLHINEVYPYESEVITYVLARLQDAGVDYQQDSFSNIIARVPGEGEPLLLSTHVDIPEPVPHLQYDIRGDRIYSDGNGILGVDPKTGLAVLLELVDDLMNEPPSAHRPVELLLTRGEEAGLVGARNADYSLLTARHGFVLDQDGPVTEVVTRAPSYVSLNGECIGKAAHPREPKQGINALEAACKTLADCPWSYSKEGVTWNIGFFQAGTAVNTIPGRVTFQSELRGYDHAEVIAEANRLTEHFKAYEATYNVTWNLSTHVEFEGYYVSEEESDLIAQFKDVLQEHHLTPHYLETFGGTDANIMTSHGIEAVPLGSGYYNAHQYSEYADLADMSQIADVLTTYVHR